MLKLQTTNTDPIHQTLKTIQYPLNRIETPSEGPFQSALEDLVIGLGGRTQPQNQF